MLHPYVTVVDFCAVKYSVVFLCYRESAKIYAQSLKQITYQIATFSYIFWIVKDEVLCRFVIILTKTFW